MQQKYYADMSTDEDGTTSDDPILMGASSPIPAPAPLGGLFPDTTYALSRNPVTRKWSVKVMVDGEYQTIASDMTLQEARRRQAQAQRVGERPPASSQEVERAERGESMAITDDGVEGDATPDIPEPTATQGRRQAYKNLSDCKLQESFMETITELESRARFPHHAYVTVLENKLARMKEELERRNVSWFPSTQVEDVPEEAPYPEPEPAPMEGQTPTTPKEREKLARRFGRDIRTLMRNMQRPTPPYPDAADAIRAGIEKITDAEGQEEMLRAWRGYVDGDPKAEKVIRLWVDGGGLFDAPAPMDTHHPRNPRENPLPRPPGSPERPLWNLSP